MGLNEGEKAECKEIAREIIKEVLFEHIRSCPHGIAIIKSKMFLVGICIGSGIAGGSAALALARLFINV